MRVIASLGVSLLLSAALGFGAQDPEALLRSGQRWLDAGNARAAVESFRRLAAAAPDSRSHYYLGVALLRDDRPEEAVAALRRAQSLAETPNPALTLSLGTALLRTGASQEAIEVLTEGARHFPRAAPILVQLGYAHYTRLEGEMARAALRRARAAAPNNAQAPFYLGLAEAALGALEPAAEAFGEAVVLDPGNFEAQVALGRTLAQLGRPERAREAYQAALATAPGLPAALVGLGRLELEAGRPEGAAASFEAALAADPRHRQALYNLAAALALLGRTEEAAAVRRRFAEAAAAGEEAGRSLSRTRSKARPR
ncbi:MAG: tetratricopeptide repeat protein [Acidobacteriota bacterium]|nr:tetratricopeptide repeat protein [Acidobacteriota bacterium]